MPADAEEVRKDDAADDGSRRLIFLTLWAVVVLTLITEQFWSSWRTLG